MEVVTSYAKNFYNYLKTALTGSSKKLRPSVNIIATQFGFYFTVYLVLCYAMYIASLVFRRQLTRLQYFDSCAKRVLLVIAHPDDECLFFGPMIVRLAKTKKSLIYVLCLSSGNSDQKGHLRKKELWDSCRVLGVSMENIFLCCSALRIDGHQYLWKSEMIATLIYDYVEAFDIDTVVTFDKQGVSGHQNHMSLFRAVSFLSLRSWLPANCRVFLLDSLGLIRKYSSVMDCALSIITSENVFILSPEEHECVKEAMRMHKTQIAWYHKIYMCFSRYTYINTYHELQRFQG